MLATRNNVSDPVRLATRINHPHCPPASTPTPVPFHISNLLGGFLCHLKIFCKQKKKVHKLQEADQEIHGAKTIKTWTKIQIHFPWPTGPCIPACLPTVFLSWDFIANQNFLMLLKQARFIPVVPLSPDLAPTFS